MIARYCQPVRHRADHARDELSRYRRADRGGGLEESLRSDGAEGNVAVGFDTAGALTRPDGHYVPYTITNTGTEAISTADLRLEVYDGDHLVDSAEITVRLLPLRGTQDGVFVTTFDPATHDLRAQLVSLQFP